MENTTTTRLIFKTVATALAVPTEDKKVTLDPETQKLLPTSSNPRVPQIA